jgi:hypothetical protein
MDAMGIKQFLVIIMVCFDFLKPHEQFFSYLTAVTITCDRATNLDLCVTLIAFSSEGYFTCCDTGPFLRSYSKELDP